MRGGLLLNHLGTPYAEILRVNRKIKFDYNAKVVSQWDVSPKERRSRVSQR